MNFIKSSNTGSDFTGDLSSSVDNLSSRLWEASLWTFSGWILMEFVPGVLILAKEASGPSGLGENFPKSLGSLVKATVF